MKVFDIIGLVLSAAGAVVLGISNMKHAEDAATKAVNEAVNDAFEFTVQNDNDDE